MVNIAIRIVNSLKAAAHIFAALVLSAALASALSAQEQPVRPQAKGEEHRPANVRLAMPMMNAERGM
ncbi:MAG: hypothetical protein V3T27_05960, partial [Alphaproteobacteria bacterium]